MCWDSNQVKTQFGTLTNVAGTGAQPKPTVLVSGPNEAQVFDVSSQKEFGEKQSDSKNWILFRNTLHRQNVGQQGG